MKNKLFTKKFLFIPLLAALSGALFSILLLNSCAYKPSSVYVSQVLGKKVYAKVLVNAEDPKNSVALKDALDEVILNQFHLILVSNASEADTFMNISLNSISFDPIEYDANGYVNIYRANISLNLSYTYKGKTGSISKSSSEEFSIQGGSTISAIQRYTAIKNAAQKALNKMVSLLAFRGYNAK